MSAELLIRRNCVARWRLRSLQGNPVRIVWAIADLERSGRYLPAVVAHSTLSYPDRGYSACLLCCELRGAPERTLSAVLSSTVRMPCEGRVQGGAMSGTAMLMGQAEARPPAGLCAVSGVK